MFTIGTARTLQALKTVAGQAFKAYYGYLKIEYKKSPSIWRCKDELSKICKETLTGIGVLVLKNSNVS